MKPQRVVSKKTGKRGWKFRFTVPGTWQRSYKTFWLVDKHEACRAFEQHLDGLQKKELGIATHEVWRTPYEELVRVFLEQSPLSSVTRKKNLTVRLERNLLGIKRAAELNPGLLNSRIAKIKDQHSENFVHDSIQRPLKQMARFLSEIRFFPHNPLAEWRLYPWSGVRKKRKAYLPAHIHAILDAMDTYDTLFDRTFPQTIPILALLLTGNRPRAVFSCNVGDVDWDRNKLNLPPGNGNKKNGLAYLPKEFLPLLREYVDLRGDAEAGEPLFVSPRGYRLDLVRYSRDFMQALALAFVKMHWPEGEEGVDPVEVAHRLHFGKVRGCGGPKNVRMPEKYAKRQEKRSLVEKMVELIGSQVAEDLDGRDMYALRHTHVTWARRFTNPDSVKAQVGHAGKDTEERFYNDLALVDAGSASEVVWDVIQGRKMVEKPGKTGPCGRMTNSA